ncbi:MAG: serine hydrolase [Lachnospiraceae bacterium]|nr:serine hydrolase [Lachnospiraceae bacterium]
MLLSLCSIFFTGCSSNSYDIPYDVNTEISAYSFGVNDSKNVLTSFTNDICVVNEDINVNNADLTLESAGCLFDRTTKETLYSKSANLSLHPASTTKVMTALLALKYGRLDDILTASENVQIKEKGAQLCGFKEGDKATLEQVLNALLIYSGNDAGVMIAEYVSGSEEAFANLMNEEAKKLGATNTHFVNPHGLTNEEHLTTAYDLYLIFNEALKYDKFKEIISQKTYQSSYSSKDGGSKKLDFENTNRFVNGKVNSPSSVSVVGGKTGTTDAAGACLILYSTNDRSGDEYISVIMNSESPESLYENMNSVLALEN